MENTEHCDHEWSNWEEENCGCLRYIQHSFSHDDPDPNCQRCGGSGHYYVRRCNICGEVEER